MGASVKARYAGGVLTPLEPLDLEEGEEVRLSIEGSQPSGAPRESLVEMFDRLRKSVPPDTWDDMPADLVRNKKHYLYGHPREED
ncbi:MAG: antitoxin family protein [Chloroflexota bacterium]|nr:antitoxin family protein [Chloroflexota bacterium]